MPLDEVPTFVIRRTAWRSQHLWELIQIEGQSILPHRLLLKSHADALGQFERLAAMVGGRCIAERDVEPGEKIRPRPAQKWLNPAP